MIELFLPFDRFFGGFSAWVLWSAGNLVVGAVVVAVAVICALIVRGIRFLIKR